MGTVSDARRCTGATTVRPVSVRIRGGRHPRCCCSTARCGSHQGGTERRAVLETATRRQRTAVRESSEEAGLSASGGIAGTVVTAEVCGVDHDARLDLHHRCRRCPRGCWTPLPESAELRWVAENEVADLPLHPGFAPVGGDWTAPATARWRGATNGGSGRAPFRSRRVLWCTRATWTAPRRWVGGSIRFAVSADRAARPPPWVVESRAATIRRHRHPSTAGSRCVDAADSGPRLSSPPSSAATRYQL